MLLLLAFYVGSALAYEQPRLGGDRDGSGCKSSAGYTWCAPMGRCVRPWLTPCRSHQLVEGDVCYRFCEDASLPSIARRGECPAGTACHRTLPPRMAGFDSCHTPDTCQRVEPTAPAAGCSDDSECGAGFCRPATHDYSGPKACASFAAAGESCGGYAPAHLQTRCGPDLECVNTLGPAIADAPGTCSAPCDGGAARDAWGNCVAAGCAVWFDGCNTCTGAGTRAQSCTDAFCMRPSGPAECRGWALGYGPAGATGHI